VRIKEISVKGLFGVFDHLIPMRMEDQITIIHGPNGFGKTILLKMLYGMFARRYQVLRDIPFGSLTITFQSSERLVVTKKLDNSVPEKSNGTSKILLFEFFDRKNKKQEFTPKHPSGKDIDFPLRAIETFTDLERIDPETWLNPATQEILSLQEAIEGFSENLPFPLKEIKDPPWLKRIRETLPIRFIETQRLLRPSSQRRKRPSSWGPFSTMVPAVANYSEELSKAIQSKLAEYATLSQSLDRTFPTRLLKELPTHNLTLEDLRNQLSQLEEKRERLVEAGLLDKEQELDISVLQKIDESNRNVLSVYVEDASKKLKVLDELSEKIDVLRRIVNSRFQYKELFVGSKEHGFTFKASSGETLHPTNLSSGEQHELVLFYELLFKVAPNSLILIDEPELSLHIIWQQQFLKDLAQITKLGKFDVLIATHSPQIIHDRWDLAVELKGRVE